MSRLLDKRLVFVTGKGGVGKSTVAAALGLAAARAGKRTIVCEVSEQERISRLFRAEGVGYRETQLADRLYGMSVDPEHAQEEYLREQLRSRALYRLLVDNRIFSYLAAATPGLRELVTIGKIWELAQLERRDRRNAPYDLVVVDAPATGHGLGMLETPRTFRDVARIGPLARRADLIHSFLVDPAQTAVAVVALPEEMPVNETIELAGSLQSRLDVEVAAVIVNGLYPERFSSAEARRIAGSLDTRTPVLESALHAALAEHNRARTQRAQLRRLRRELEPVLTLPYLFEPDLDLDELERLSRELERRL